MFKLSPRLREIANLVSGPVLMDVGTDHAYLPIVLLQEEKIEKAYAIDIREGPLEIAKKNLKKTNLEDKVTLVLNDGLIKEKADTVVIAGMGYDNAVAILENADLSYYQKFIIQINRKSDLFREYLKEKDYRIINESFCSDREKDYEIICFDTVNNNKYSEIDLLLGPCLSKRKDEEYMSYLKRMLEHSYQLKEVDEKEKKRYELLRSYLKTV